MPMFSGRRFLGRPLIPGAQYYRYVPIHPNIIASMGMTTEKITPSFQYVTEDALEREYHRGQQEMVDKWRAKYRRLTEEDLWWLRTPDKNPLREAMKYSWYTQYVRCLPDIPVELALIVKRAAESDSPYWQRFRFAQDCNRAGVDMAGR